MNDQPKTGRLEVPTFRGLIWLVASITGLWFVVRAGDPRQIGENLYPYYVGYAAGIFLAFEWGRVFGGLFYEGGRTTSRSLSQLPSRQLFSGSYGEPKPLRRSAML
jgi:hypothetical protein